MKKLRVIAGQKTTAAIDTALPWWKNGVIYQIYPKSFQDSTNNGLGDLKGIISRLVYLHLLGVDAIWLTPIYPSPQIDNGYDVANYCDIDPNYGTLKDFKSLCDAAHKMGIKIMMDMVFNHTSTEHYWFKAASDKKSPFRSFYIWKPASETGELPNNWRSKFGGSAWQFHNKSGEYYLHLFAPEQADLNWEHPPVRKALKKVCEFWANQGVDALRLDVINLVSKDQRFLSETEEINLDNKLDNNLNKVASRSHINTPKEGRRFYTDGPRIHEFLQELSADVFKPHQLMTVGEMSSTSLAHCQQYANQDGSELSMTFNFHHLKVDYAAGEKWTLAKPDFIALKHIFNTWQQGMHNRGWNALFWCNHDQPRIVSRFGVDQIEKLRILSAKLLAMALHGLQGTPYIYQGEELGMTNPHFTKMHEYRDIESINMMKEYVAKGISESEILAILAQKSRDNARSPMQWDASTYAGFSQHQPWINLSDNYERVNVVAAISDSDSIFYTYQRLIKMRKVFDIFTLGDYEDLIPQHPYIWCYLRRYQNQALLVLANLSDKKQSYTLEMPLQFYQTMRKLMSNYSKVPELNLDTPVLLRAFEAQYWLVGY